MPWHSKIVQRAKRLPTSITEFTANEKYVVLEPRKLIVAFTKAEPLYSCSWLINSGCKPGVYVNSGLDLRLMLTIPEILVGKRVCAKNTKRLDKHCGRLGIFRASRWGVLRHPSYMITEVTVAQ